MAVMTGPLLALVDFGSTFTKVRVLGVSGLVATAEDRTTVDRDVFDGLDAALERIWCDHPELRIDRVVACSSAGGGLRMGVVGLVEDLTAEAARAAALGAGARVVGTVSGGLDSPSKTRELLAAEPDIVLVAGGTDGGDRASLLVSASALAKAKTGVPVIVAGNKEIRGAAETILRDAGIHTVGAANVMPRIDALAPDGVRRVIRELFISHVIGGKLAGSSARLEEVVRMATPDAVGLGVEALGLVLEEVGEPGSVVVVDVGGATTDVYSWTRGATSPGYKRLLLPHAISARTVEADLGMRWNALGIVEAGNKEGLLSSADVDVLGPASERRAANPGFLPEDDVELEIDRTLARTAIAVALRRHAGRRRFTLTPDGAVVHCDGRDLSDIRILLGIGGVLRKMDRGELSAALELARRGRESRLLPDAPLMAIDPRGILAAAGLLMTEDEESARRLLRTELAPKLPGKEENVVTSY